MCMNLFARPAYSPSAAAPGQPVASAVRWRLRKPALIRAAMYVPSRHIAGVVVGKLRTAPRDPVQSRRPSHLVASVGLRLVRDAEIGGSATGVHGGDAERRQHPAR